jgi:hypothetical protein
VRRRIPVVLDSFCDGRRPRIHGAHSPVGGARRDNGVALQRRLVELTLYHVLERRNGELALWLCVDEDVSKETYSCQKRPITALQCTCVDEDLSKETYSCQKILITVYLR